MELLLCCCCDPNPVLLSEFIYMMRFYIKNVDLMACCEFAINVMLLFR